MNRHPAPFVTLLLAFATVACQDVPTSPPGVLPEGTPLAADVTLLIEVVPGPRGDGTAPASITATTRMTARLKDGRFVFERTSPSPAGGGLMTSTTTYAVDDSVMADILPALSFLSASYAPPDSSGWEDLGYTSADGHEMTWDDVSGSIGQPLWGTLVIDGLTEYKELLTWTTTSYGVTLNTAKYEVSEPTSESLIKMTAIVDSMRVTVLSQAPWRQAPNAIAAGCIRQAAKATAGVVGGTPFWPTTLSAEVMTSLAVGECFDRKVDLWIARGWMVAAEIAFLMTPTPATFAAFIVSMANVGVARGRMLQSCRK